MALSRHGWALALLFALSVLPSASAFPPRASTPDEERARQMVDDLERYAKAIEQIAKDVGSGTFKTRDEVREAVGKARQPR